MRSSQALIGGPRMMLTREAGQFRFPNLTPGSQCPRHRDAGSKQCVLLPGGKVDQHNIRILSQAIENDLFTIRCNIKRPHGSAVVETRELSRLHGCYVE